MSMGGGGGKGSATQTINSPAASTLANLATQFAGETTGVRTGLIKAMQDVLRTGGSKIPIISRSVEASRSAASKATQDTEDRLALEGLAGTPWGEDVLAKQRMQGEIAAGNVEQSLAQNIFNMIANFVLGQSQTALSGLAGAIPGMNTTSGSQQAMGFGAGKQF